MENRIEKKMYRALMKHATNLSDHSKPPHLYGLPKIIMTYYESVQASSGEIFYINNYKILF